MTWGLELMKKAAQKVFADNLLSVGSESNCVIPMASFICTETVLKTKILKLLNSDVTL